MKKFFLLPVLLLCTTICRAFPVVVSSPDKQLKLTLNESTDGQALISIDYQGKSLIDNSPIGFEFQDGYFGKHLRVGKKKASTIVDDYDMPIGKCSHVHSKSRQIAVTLTDKNGRQVEMYLRAFNDGVAYRYVIPQQKGMDRLAIKNEKMELNPVGNPVVKMMCLDGFQSSHEDVYTTARMDKWEDGKVADMPTLLCYDNGKYMAITEAMVVDYAGMLMTTRNGKLSGKLSPRLDQPELSVIGDLPHRTPWRVFLVSDRVGALLESNILTTLCDPCKEKDLDWLNPGKTSWPWWNGYQAPAEIKQGDLNTRNYNLCRYYIDFCAENNIRYHSISGILDENNHETNWYYNEGSAPGAPKPSDDGTRLCPGFDIVPICDYAREKGVDMRVWIHWKTLAQDIEGCFRQFAKWGIKGMMIDYMNRDDQQMIELEQEMLELAMKYHLHIQFHGASKPSGLQRTYPCEFTRENTLNYEVYKWDHQRKMGADHDLDLPFTRCLAGPTDYHLGGFRAVTDQEFQVNSGCPVVTSTRCHMLGLYVVYESALALVSDAPEAYRGQDGFDFIKAVPTVWDETRVPSAVVDQYVVVARRSGKEWYIGSIGNKEGEQEVTLPLDFLGKGTYRMVSYEDAPDTDVSPNHLLTKEADVKSGTTLKIRLAKSGGFAARLVPAE